MARVGSCANVLELPTEMLQRVFQLLHLADLHSVVKVCRRWRDVGESACLWTSVVPSVNEENINCLAGRLKNISEARVASLSPEVLKALEEHPTLRGITIDKTARVWEADPGALGSLFASMERVNMAKVPDKRVRGFNYSQLKVLFAKLSESTTLRHLNLNYNNLASVPPHLMSNVVEKLESLEMSDANLAEEHALWIFQVLSSSKRIKHLVLSSNNLKMARNEDFEGALENVTYLNLANTQSCHKLVSVLRALEKGGKIEELNLSLSNLRNNEGTMTDPDISRVTELASRVIPKCRSVQLRLFDYIRWRDLFTALSIATSPWPEELDISKNNLSLYNTESLASALELAAAVTKIVRVKLMETKLSKLQSSSIFKRICQGGERIEDLDIMFNNLSQLDPDHLAQAVTKLVRVKLGWSKLNNRQLERMFERLDDEKNGKLRELKLSGVDLSRLDRRLLARVVSGLEVVDLNFTKLRLEQVTALLHRLEENGRQLKDLTLSTNDLSQVNPDLLASIVCGRLERANLWEANLTSTQVESITKRLLSPTKLKFLDIRKNNCDEEIPPDVLKKIKILS